MLQKYLKKQQAATFCSSLFSVFCGASSFVTWQSCILTLQTFSTAVSFFPFASSICVSRVRVRFSTSSSRLWGKHAFKTRRSIVVVVLPLVPFLESSVVVFSCTVLRKRLILFSPSTVRFLVPITSSHSSHAQSASLHASQLFFSEHLIHCSLSTKLQRPSSQISSVHGSPSTQRGADRQPNSGSQERMVQGSSVPQTTGELSQTPAPLQAFLMQRFSTF